MAVAHNLAQTSLPSPSTSIPLSDFLLSQNSPLLLSSKPALASDLARALEITLGAPLEKVSLRWIGWENPFASSDAAPKAGFQHLVEKLNDKAQSLGSETRLGEHVNSVERPEVVALPWSLTRQCIMLALLCVPLGVLKQDPLSYTPLLPARRHETITGTHVNVLEKLVLIYPVARWPGGFSVRSFTFLPKHLAISRGYSYVKVSSHFIPSLCRGRLGFAGEHMDTDHRGSVAGAVVSSQREAAQVGRLLAQQ
ncbi:hypothetical protein JB92DRAFT_3113039 [Gautieria morchelliformis]|nr:hypothetical protein JB92DRAFT_3113039 [Gautieria morchelliformis]